MYRCFIIWDSRWYIIALPLLTFLASSGTPNVICRSFGGVADFCVLDLSFPFPFLSACDPHNSRGRSARQICAKRWQSCSSRRGVGLADRQLEYYRHLDDMLPSPAGASTHARGALTRGVQRVHKHRGGAHRVRCPVFRHRDRSRRRGGQAFTVHLCIFRYLGLVLR